VASPCKCGIAGIDHGGKDLVIDIDQRRGVLRHIAVPRHHQCDRLADERNLARAQRVRPQRIARLSALRRLAHHTPLRQHGHEIIERQHRMHAVERTRGRGLDALDQRMSVRTAHERDVQQIGKTDVVDVAALAGQKRWIFEPPEARADPSIVFLRRNRAQFVMALAARAMTSFGSA
jgi:hypothetical protein